MNPETRKLRRDNGRALGLERRTIWRRRPAAIVRAWWWTLALAGWCLWSLTGWWRRESHRAVASWRADHPPKP